MKFEHRYKNPDSAEFADLSILFHTVVESILEIKSLPLISAIPYDDEAKRPRVFNALAIEYLSDLDRATRFALSHGGQLDADLWNCFVALVKGEQVAPALRREVIARCARIYKARKLHPNSYFRRYRNHSAHSIGRAA